MLEDLRATKYEGRIVNVGRLGGMTGEFDFDLHALRRINYRQWQRNVAVALGNAPYDPAIVALLEARRAALDPTTDAMVLEHIDWALQEQRSRSDELRH